MSHSQHNQLDSTANGEERSNSFLTNNRCSFCFTCCFGSRHPTVGFAWWERVRATSSSPHSQPTTGSPAARWWSRGATALLKVREWSELAAGPRWKTFIRRFNRSRSGGSRHVAVARYQYDPLSYSLNFDEGQNGDFDDESYNNGLRNFSTRYAASVPSKSVSTETNQDVAVLG